MKNTERFSNRVANYVKYRPDYPQEILETFRTEMNLKPSSIIADVGAGTGIFTKIFLENGNFVYAVEPNAAMREAAAEFLQDYSNFQLIEGTSENTTLDDESVDLVVAAQAFHWFDKAKARAEFRRILRTDGYVALVWNERQLDSTEFLREYERFLIKFGTDYSQTRHDNISDETFRDFFQKDFRKATFQNVQALDFEGIKGRLLSSSYTPTEESPLYKPMLEELNLLFTKYQENGKIHLLYDTNIYYGQL